MKIRTKLNGNMLLTAVGILVIAGFSFSGMKFVQGKLHVLTERSTPYQLKTITLQGALQEHISNLLKTSAVGNEADLKTMTAETGKSLETFTRLSAELSDMKGQAASSNTKTEDLKKITEAIIGTTGQRIKAETDRKAADALINDKLRAISTNLSRVGTLIKTNQKKSVSELSTTNDGAKRSTVKLNQTQITISLINDYRIALMEIINADEKSELTAASAKLASSGQAITKGTFLKLERNTPVAKELGATIPDITKAVTGPGGLAEQRGALIASPAHDDAVHKRLDREGGVLTQRLVKLTAMLNEHAAKINEAAREEGKKFDGSLEGSVIQSETLAMSGDLIETCIEIKATIKEMFLASSEDELKKLRTQSEQLFTRTTPILATTKFKSTQGSAAVQSALALVRQTLLAKDGVADKLLNIIKVRHEVEALNTKLKTIVSEQHSEGEDAMAKARTEQEEAVKSVNKVFKSSIIGVIVIGLVVLALSLLFSQLLVRSITKPIKELSSFAERFGSGDFSYSLKDGCGDEFCELGTHFNQASTRLREIVTGLVSAINILGQNSSQLSEVSQLLSAGSHEQASQTIQSATALEQMTRTISEVAQNANEAAQATREASAAAENGQVTVSSTIEGMSAIADSVKQAAETIKQLGASSDQIGEIIGVINDIADQTNLLALNAAIEAARAGEVGMGFAVVADEVRRLALRTTEATKEIGDVISRFQKDTEHCIVSMRRGEAEVDKGVALATTAGRSLEEIVKASDQGAGMVNQIATASEEQSKVAAEVSSGVERIAELSRQAEDASARVNQTASELGRIAGELGDKASWFKI